LNDMFEGHSEPWAQRVTAALVRHDMENRVGRHRGWAWARQSDRTRDSGRV